MVSSIGVGPRCGGVPEPASAGRRQDRGQGSGARSSARSSAGSTSAPAKAWPMPRSSTKREAAVLDLLVARHGGDQRARARGRRPLIAARRVGSPTAARWRRMRSASAAGQRPSRTESAAASTMPSATASPCSSARHSRRAPRSAWPKVWPRLSSARAPLLALVGSRPAPPWRGSSRGSRAAAARASPASSAAPVPLEPGEEVRPVDHAVLDHLGVARPQLPRPAGSPARRYPRAPGAAGGSCRSGSCPGAR